MDVKQATLQSFDSIAYTATVRLTGSHTALEDIPVARNLPAAEMTAGRRVGVIFFDEHNPKETVVIAVYT